MSSVTFAVRDHQGIDAELGAAIGARHRRERGVRPDPLKVWATIGRARRLVVRIPRREILEERERALLRARAGDRLGAFDWTAVSCDLHPGLVGDLLGHGGRGRQHQAKR